MPTAVEERFALQRESAYAQSRQGVEDHIQIAVSTGIQDMNSQPKGPRSLLHWFKVFFEDWTFRIDQHGYDVRHGNQLMEQPDPLHRKYIIEQTNSGNVAARPIEARDKAKADWIGDRGEDDGNA
jgi:hypothetical protein